MAVIIVQVQWQQRRLRGSGWLLRVLWLEKNTAHTFLGVHQHVLQLRASIGGLTTGNVILVIEAPTNNLYDAVYSLRPVKAVPACAL